MSTAPGLLQTHEFHTAFKVELDSEFAKYRPFICSVETTRAMAAWVALENLTEKAIGNNTTGRSLPERVITFAATTVLATMLVDMRRGDEIPNGDVPAAKVAVARASKRLRRQLSITSVLNGATGPLRSYLAAVTEAQEFLAVGD